MLFLRHWVQKNVTSEKEPKAVWFIAEMIDEDFYRDYFGLGCNKVSVKNIARDWSIV